MDLTALPDSSRFRSASRGRWSLTGLALAALTLALATNLLTGPLAISPRDILTSLLGGEAPDQVSVVLWQLRLPRALMAMATGAALGCSGAIMQGLFRNPMADPGLIGVSSGAGLAAAAMIVIGGATLPLTAVPVFLPVAAFAGGLAVTFGMLHLARIEGETAVLLLLLAGIAMNALAGAGIGLMSYLSDDRQLRDLTFWLMGSLNGASWNKLTLVLPFLLLPLLLGPWLGKALDALNLGEREAGHLGIPVESTKRRACLLVALAVGGSVAFCGIIGFIGLVVPHLVRLGFGSGHRWLLPISAAGGAMLLLLADAAARSLAAPADLPVGIVTSLIGTPFFLALLLRKRREFSA